MTEMSEDEHLSAVIGDIYDAALDTSLWPSVLGKAAGFVRAISGGLYWKDAAHKVGGVYFQDGKLDRDYVQLYFEKYVKLDPSTAGQYFAEIEKPIATEDVIDYDEFRETRFYREWARPQGLVDCVNAVLDRSATSLAIVGMFRHEREGRADDETRRRMSLLVPHVRRAVLIGRVIEQRAAEAASLADSLDGLSAGMFLVDDAGRIVHANVAGHVMLGDGGVLRAIGGKLCASDMDSERQLRDAILAAADGDAGLGVKGISVPLSGPDGEPHAAHVLPLTSGARRRAGSTYAAAAAIFVHRASLDLPSPPETIAKTYKLTPAELRVLLAIVEVGGVPEVADALGIAETTVKTHLGRLYVKTDCRRQAELVKVVAGFANPLVG